MSGSGIAKMHHRMMLGISEVSSNDLVAPASLGPAT